MAIVNDVVGECVEAINIGVESRSNYKLGLPCFGIFGCLLLLKEVRMKAGRPVE
jgi:hypothetical protein